MERVTLMGERVGGSKGERRKGINNINDVWKKPSLWNHTILYLPKTHIINKMYGYT